MLEELMDLVAGGTSKVMLGAAAHAATIENSPVLLKKPSPIRTYLCQVGPHHCGNQVRCRLNGLMCVGLSSHRTPMKSGRYAYTVRSLSATTPRVFVKKIKVAYLALASLRGDYAPQCHHDQRPHLKERSSPYDPQQRKKQGSPGTKRPIRATHRPSIWPVRAPMSKMRKACTTTCTPRPFVQWPVMRLRQPPFSSSVVFSVIRVAPCIHVTFACRTAPRLCVSPF